MADYSLITVLIISVNLIFVRSQQYMLTSIGNGTIEEGNSALFCTDVAEFECEAVGVPAVLDWYVNGSQQRIATYSFRDSDIASFPVMFTIESEFLNSVMANVTRGLRINSFMVNMASILQANIDDFIKSTIQCGSESANTSNSLLILRRDRESPQNLRVRTLFVDGLFVYLVEWQVSESECPGIPYTFIVELQNETGQVWTHKNVTCANRNCSVNVPFPNVDGKFKIQVIATDRQGNPVLSTANTSQLLDGIPANVSKPSIVFSGCYTSVTCVSLVPGRCEIDIFLGEKRVATGSGSTNASIDLAGLSPNMQYSYKGFVHADVVYELERNFSTTEYADKWTDGILACVILGPILMTLSIILCIGIGICLRIKWNDFKDDAVIKYAFIFILSLSSAVLVVSIVNFIAGVVEVSGNCDNLQQPLQILIAACVFSGFTVLLDLIFICGLPVYYVVVYQLDKNVQVKPTQSKAQETLHLYGVTDEVARQSDTHGLSEAERTVSTSGHRKYGESSQQGMLRVKEDLHQAANKFKKEETCNIYDKINRDGSDTKEKENLPPSQYDGLNNGKASESQAYDALQRDGTAQQVPPGRLVPKDDYDHIKEVDTDSKNKETSNANKIAPTAGNSDGHPQQNPQGNKQYKPSKKDTNLTKL